MTNSSFYHPTHAPIPGDALMDVRRHMETTDLDNAVWNVAAEWGNIDPKALRVEFVKVFPVPTLACERYGHHFHPQTHHCNRCGELEPVDTDRTLTKHGYKARRVTLAQEAAMDSLDTSLPKPIIRVDVLNESFNLAIIVHTTDGAKWIIAQDGTVGAL